MIISRRDTRLAPLSFPQERMFLLDRIMPGIPAYNVPRLAKVATRLDPEALQNALDGIVARHEILRTRIILSDGEPVQEVMPEAPVPLRVADVSALEPEEREAAAMAAVAEVAWRPFDISGDVLLRAALVRLGPDSDLLLLVNHHLGSDHVSGAMLLDELGQRYDAVVRGADPALPELEIQYADFAAWQRSYLCGDLLEELLAHWLKVLEGAPDRLELPTDRPRPAEQSYRGETLDLTLAPEVAQRLQALARSGGVSLFVVLLSAWATLMHRYSGQSEIVIGTPVSGRNYEETASLVGYFSNTLPLRTDLSGDPTFRELLGRLGPVTRTALAYQELPFERLVQAVNPDRAASHTPIFQVLFGFDIDPTAERTFAGAALERLPIPGNDFARFDLSLVVRQRTDGRITGALEYSSDLFDACTAQRLLAHYQTLVQEIARDPDQRLSKLPLLSAAERRLMLEDWNRTAVEYPAQCLHELFAQQAASRPDALAVQFEHDRLSYAELDRRSSQLANLLVERGAGRGTLVGIAMSRRCELVVALFAVLKTGAAYVPIDPSYPQQRVAFMLESAAVPVLLSEERLLAGLPPHSAEVICLDRDWPQIDAYSASAPEVHTDPGDLAYVIYTSGSTGKPKGVEIAHRSVVNLITHMRTAPGLDAGDIVANLTTHAFDLSVPDWYLPLCHGAQLVVVPPEETMDGIALADRLRRAGATFVQATPTTWQMLLDAGWHGSERLKIVCGGEALPRALANELLHKGAELWHMYGPTETTVWSSILRLQAGEGPPPLGGPIANTTLYVLDAAGEPVPIGVPGELYIGGDGVARGYRDRPDLTVERFVADAFTGAGRLYRTGDLVRWREDGTLQYLGRIDQQIKLRGFRIELEEIEAVLAGHPLVSAVAAAVREDGAADKRLVAYFVPSDAGSPDVDELRKLARTHLPPYMVPSTFVELEAMPTSANRKLDRAALPAPGTARLTHRPYAPPVSPVEVKLAEIWQEILGVDRVGIEDDFFDLGGHSLLAVKLGARIFESLDVELRLTLIFDHPTIAELGDVISAQMLGEASDEDLEAMLAELEGGM